MTKLDYQTARHAVCFLLMNQDNEVLSISRGNTDLWGLPGGKVEPGETLKSALVREVFEETGYVVADLESVYTAFVPGETNFICTTFIGRVVAQASDAPRSEPFEGHVKWQLPALLARLSPFADYNRALFEHVNIQWGRLPPGVLPFDR